VGAAAPTNASKQRPGSKPSKGNAFADSNVREVLAALGDTSETGQRQQRPESKQVQSDAYLGVAQKNLGLAVTLLD